MKSEYINESAIVLNPMDNEVTILFNLNHVDFKYNETGGGKDTSFIRTEVCKIMMSMTEANKLVQRLIECIEQYHDYHKKESESRNEKP